MNSVSDFDHYISKNKIIRSIGFIASFALLLLATISIFPIISKSEQVEASYTPSVTTLDITSTSTTANVDVAPTSSNGTFATSTAGDEVAFGVTTNNLTGYTLSIEGSDGTGELINSNTSDTLETIATATDADTFATGASSTYTNKWGILPSKHNSLANTDYLPAPTTTTAISVDTTNAPNTTANNYTVGLGARVNYEKPNGTYTNTFTLMAVGNPISYQINYLDNSSGSDVAILPMEGANDIETSGFIISSTVPTRAGYTFNKWCEGTVTHVASGNSTCDGTEYVAGANYNFSSLSPVSINTADFYAMWNVNTYDVKVNFAGVGVSSVTFAAAGQTTRTVSNSGDTAALTYDIPYTMTMNLANTTNYKFSSWALNNVSYGTISSTSANPTTFTANADSDNAIITATGDWTKLYIQNITASQCTTTAKTVYDIRDEQSYIIQKLADNKCWMMTNLNLGATSSLTVTQLDNTNTNFTGSNASKTIAASTFLSSSWKKTSAVQTHTAPEYIPVSGTDATSGTRYGTVYNYCAASGQTICTASNSSNATSDLCPKGWRLPTGGDSGEFRALYNSGYNSLAKMRASIASGGAAFALAGYFNSGKPTEQNSDGTYWSSTRYDSVLMYRLNLRTNSVSFNGYSYRDTGVSIRCVLK